MSDHPKESWRSLIRYMLGGSWRILLYVIVALVAVVIAKPIIDYLIDHSAVQRAQVLWSNNKPLAYQITLYNDDFV